MLQSLINRGFDVLALHHAEAILTYDMPEAIQELERVLSEIQLPVEELVRLGGGEGKLTQRLRHALTELGWVKHNFEIKKIVDGIEKESVSHEIDHVKSFESGIFALEIEWNNKDPFYDRDLENFKRLHADGVISIGGIITRGSSLQNSIRDIIIEFAHMHNIKNMETLNYYYNPTRRQIEKIRNSLNRGKEFEEAWGNAFVSDKFGEATTHWRKLEARIERGVGNPCPLLLIGIPDTVLIF